MTSRAGNARSDKLSLRAATFFSDSSGEALPEDVLAALRRLSRHYIPARYPNAHPAGTPGIHYGREDADEALADADAILKHVNGFWARLSTAAEEEDDER